MIDINLKDSNGKFEYTIECDPEKGFVYAWHVNLVDPMPLQTILNIPMLMRQASSSPCSGGVQAPTAMPGQGPTLVQQDTRVKKIRIGRDGTPIVER